MEKRIGEVLDINPAGSWEVVFNEGREMAGHQTKYQHIVDRTMLRPRDVIKFCNTIAVSYKNNSTRGEKFDNEDVATSRKEYSDYLLRELTDEIFKHIEGYERVFEILRELEALQFEVGEFEAICERRKELLPVGKTPRDILGELFEFSVIGYYQPGGAGYGGAEYVYRYKSPLARFNPNARSYQVHIGLLETLGLKRYRRQAGVEAQ